MVQIPISEILQSLLIVPFLYDTLYRVYHHQSKNKCLCFYLIPFDPEFNGTSSNSNNNIQCSSLRARAQCTRVYIFKGRSFFFALLVFTFLPVMQLIMPNHFLREPTDLHNQ